MYVHVARLRPAEVAAILYWLVETAMLHDVDPAAYIAKALAAESPGQLRLRWQIG